VIEPDAAVADVHAAHAGVVGVDELGALRLVVTSLEPRLECLTHARDLLAVGEHLRFGPLRANGYAELPAIAAGAGSYPRDTQLLAQRQLLI
jgi:hypothetical protein